MFCDSHGVRNRHGGGRSQRERVFVRAEKEESEGGKSEFTSVHFAYLCVCAHGVDIVVGTFILGENILQAQTRRYFEVKDLAKVNTGIGLVIYL